MESGPLPGMEEEDKREVQDSDRAYELPEEAKQYIMRLIFSRRMRQLREEFGPGIFSTEDEEE